MHKSRVWFQVVSLTLGLSIASSGWSQTPGPGSSVKTAEVECVCKFYQLRDFVESDELCLWIADAIPEVVQPASWKGSGGSGTIKFNPKLALLVINQTPAAHAEVESFLKNLKKAVVSEPEPSPPAEQNPPATTKAEDAPPTGPTGYPIPAPLQHPKHLFHFIIRFEGSGMDAAVTELTKKLSGDTSDAGKQEPKSPLNQLLHFIVRYEGDGIIDSNVVEFMKVAAKMRMQEESKVKPGNDPLVGEQPSTTKPPPSVQYYTPSPTQPASFGSQPFGSAPTQNSFGGPQPSSQPSPRDGSMPSIGVPVSPFSFPTAPSVPSGSTSLPASRQWQQTTEGAKPGTAPRLPEVLQASFPSRQPAETEEPKTPKMPLPD